MVLLWFGGIKVARTVVLLARNHFLQADRDAGDLRHAGRGLRPPAETFLRFYEARHTGKIVSRVTDDTGMVHALVTGASVNLVSDAVTIAGCWRSWSSRTRRSRR